MRPVYQTKFGPPDGNCFEACVASVLELPLGDIPAFGREGDWFRPFRLWLETRNLTCFVWSVAEDEFRPSGYSLLSVRGIGATCDHEVVAFNGEVVHDPWPFPHAGYAREIEWTVFGILDPSQPVVSPDDASSLAGSSPSPNSRRTTP